MTAFSHHSKILLLSLLSPLVPTSAVTQAFSEKGRGLLSQLALFAIAEYSTVEDSFINVFCT